MRPLLQLGRRTGQSFLLSRLRTRPCFNFCSNGDRSNDEEKERSDFDRNYDDTLLSLPPFKEHEEEFTPRRRFFRNIKLEADKIFEILQQDGPGFNTRSALEELNLKVSNALVREVLLQILISINDANKLRCAKLAYKFFTWSGQKEDYKHTSNAYNLIIKIFAETEELKAMWRLVDEMTENGLPVTAYTFNLLICSCGEAGMARKLVERFLKSKTFNYRPFKHSFNAILYSLLTVNQFRLIEWVYQKMVLEGHSPDILTYNVIMRAKYKLGKLDQFHTILDEMGKNGFAPDLHTFNLLLHVLGKADKPYAALELLEYMDLVGCSPSVLHFTTLIDGLGRAGNLDACKYFFDMMLKKGCKPDVVCYTVMIAGYVAGGEFDKAYELFNDMTIKGLLPNVFTYNSMIKGLCVSGKFDEACSMLKSMDSRGCTPNFSVYSTLVLKLRNAGKASKADEIISFMVEKGHYLHLVSKFRGYRRC
ncbi:uncharacterized protein A4U43_C10F16100 [Asparagus officinalis]|uniref:Pentacotripeptide-repeat region of PRORP domain-containing protein n=1 Tax=Asparagus officinalis TaxID=4686 RepID=A0A5P1E340_ASPOF|nr:pentatricopeptide repeat-containing protein At1g55630-like [Asparagus officinalis]XP_020247741.1 pentatricopeptide repeat-containing protein At1g55630-like [Asparagus officinalis]XP_020247742.1 pentatricopeptide repeat-containing protein At1g55630-like [Asparagus officinalis]ONK57051.1 uncharacterized protein A4U43_C10F16100 [Asparagus officinalis]